MLKEYMVRERLGTSVVDKQINLAFHRECQGPKRWRMDLFEFREVMLNFRFHELKVL